jgi:cytochrome c peroxidase
MRLGGTLTGLDTPTLHGLWRSAPYLHDGSADSLRDVLVTRNPEDRHGVTSALSPSDLDDLETFLLAL